MYGVTTTDLEMFGMREIEMVRDLLTTLTTWADKGLPDDFEDNGVKPMMNNNSGCVFLTNREYEVCMVVDGVLESFYSCPDCGHEGIAIEMREDGGACCNEYMKDRFGY